MPITFLSPILSSNYNASSKQKTAHPYYPTIEALFAVMCLVLTMTLQHAHGPTNPLGAHP